MLIKGFSQEPHMPGEGKAREELVIKVGGYVITPEEVSRDGHPIVFDEDAYGVWSMVYLLLKSGWTEEQLVKLLDELIP